MEEYLWQAGVLWKDFKRFATDLTSRVRQAAEKLAGRHQRPMIYLSSSRTRKEEVAREIQHRDQIGQGADRGFELRGTVSHVVFAGESSDPQAGDEASVG